MQISILSVLEGFWSTLKKWLLKDASKSPTPILISIRWRGLLGSIVFLERSTLITPPAIGGFVGVLWWACLCVCVCLSTIISSELHVRSWPIFLCGNLWPWLGPPLAALRTLRISGFMDYVIFATSPVAEGVPVCKKCARSFSSLSWTRPCGITEKWG